MGKSGGFHRQGPNNCDLQREWAEKRWKDDGRLEGGIEEEGEGQRKDTHTLLE